MDQAVHIHGDAPAEGKQPAPPGGAYQPVDEPTREEWVKALELSIRISDGNHEQHFLTVVAFMAVIALLGAVSGKAGFTEPKNNVFFAILSVVAGLASYGSLLLLHMNFLDKLENPGVQIKLLRKFLLLMLFVGALVLQLYCVVWLDPGANTLTLATISIFIHVAVYTFFRLYRAAHDFREILEEYPAFKKYVPKKPSILPDCCHCCRPSPRPVGHNAMAPV